MSADVEWLGGGSHQQIGGRVEPQCLLEDHPGIRQTLQIIESGRSPAQDRIDLGVETRRDFRLARQVIPHIGERQGRGVVTGQIECKHLGADLLVGQARAGFGVGHVHHQGQEVVAISTARATLLDRLRDDAAERV